MTAPRVSQLQEHPPKTSQPGLNLIRFYTFFDNESHTLERISDSKSGPKMAPILFLACKTF
jgi:hypothetical protein